MVDIAYFVDDNCKLMPHLSEGGKGVINQGGSGVELIELLKKGHQLITQQASEI